MRDVTTGATTAPAEAPPVTAPTAPPAATSAGPAGPTGSDRVLDARSLPGLLEVRDDRGRRWTWHLAWLRHQDPADVPPLTGERLADPAAIDADLTAADVRVVEVGAAVEVRWPGRGRPSRFGVGWLASVRWAGAELELPEAAPVGALELDAAGRLDVDAVRRRLVSRGAVVLRGVGPTPADTERLIAELDAGGFHLRTSHYGRIEDLRTDNATNRHTDQLGYTDSAVDLHTDLPFVADPPRYQALHAIRAADRGGDSAVADGLAVARVLRTVDPEAFERLSTTTVRLHRRQADYEAVHDTPLLVLDAYGEPMQVRSSYFTLAPLALPFGQLRPWWRAYGSYQRLLRDPAFRTELRLERGDALLYDNHRMLHARTAFDGPRWVRGIYFEPERP